MKSVDVKAVGVKSVGVRREGGVRCDGLRCENEDPPSRLWWGNFRPNHQRPKVDPPYGHQNGYIYR